MTIWPHVTISKKYTRGKVFLDSICIALFILTVVMSVRTVIYLSGTSLDSDASSELVLAEHLAETNRILSEDWIYSTELRVIDTQLVNSLLFRLTDNWRTVRIASGLIHQFLLSLSFFFLCWKSKISLRSSLLSGSILLLPISIAYGRIVLYHNYYVPHIAFSFFSIGLLLGAMNKRSKLDTILLLIIAYLSGLKGVRQLLITFAPAMLMFILRALILERKQPIISLNTFKDVLVPSAALLCCGGGSCATAY